MPQVSISKKLNHILKNSKKQSDMPKIKSLFMSVLLIANPILFIVVYIDSLGSISCFPTYSSFKKIFLSHILKIK